MSWEDYFARCELGIRARRQGAVRKGTELTMLASCFTTGRSMISSRVLVSLVACSLLEAVAEGSRQGRAITEVWREATKVQGMRL